MTKSRFQYAWVIVFVTFFALLVSAGVRNATSVLFEPLEMDFGWDRASVSFAFAISLFAFGFGAPLGGALIDRFGPRRVMLSGLVLIAFGLALMLSMTELWQFHALWGIIVGIGTGAIAGTLGATVAMRWFNQYRGLVLGLFSSASAAGQLLFLPGLIALSDVGGWQGVIGLMGLLSSLMIVPALFFMRNRPDDIGLLPIGLPTAGSLSTDGLRTSLRDAIRTRDFWLLAGSFFVCGYTTNGLITTHLLPHSIEHGFERVEVSWAIAFMGLMNIIGTTASGWLTDRVDNRKLLAIYYGMRAISLVALPFIYDMQNMLIFALVYGLDWVATVPPTVNLAAQRFGRRSLGSIYGWIFCSHMIGAGVASYAGGFFRELLGDYHLVFLSAAVLGLIATALSLGISISAKRPKAKVAPTPAAAQ